MAEEFSRIVNPLLAGVVPMALASSSRSNSRPALASWIVEAIVNASSNVCMG